MRVLHLASADRWTGAAAPAYFEVAALRAAGIDAIYGFVRGYTLQQRIASIDWAFPLIARRQDPLTFLRTGRAIRRLLRERNIDVVHAHLTHDHSIALWASRGLPTRVVRTYHSTRAIRDDLVSRQTRSRTAAICVINESFLGNPVIASRHPVFTPPPIDHTFFRPGDESVRAERGIERNATVIGFIGKMVPGRGFEQAIETFALLASDDPGARLLVVAKWSPHRELLDPLASSLGIADRIIWAGYQDDDDLVAHFRAMSLMLFTAPGSDEGHRAIPEAMACGVPVATFPLPGTGAITGPLSDRLVSASATPDSLAATARTLLSGDRASLTAFCVERTRAFAFEPTAARLLDLYASLETS
ncbi:MAG: glycosyltransferase family 4 protein [Acidobacteria bacterium]|nr:glycosyltransferase family 4 protein [Acidobacteriota bacterium]